ncbi:hypothetical protein BDC45DRAFT_567297 [Circinella umbellata]|nr:hypothetical protein BDC45DRAFT_567297 [Circinella umbellata]
MFGQKYLTAPSSSKSTIINTQAYNNNYPKKDTFSCYENLYNSINNDPMDVEIRQQQQQQQQQQSCFQLNDIETTLYTNNMLATNDTLYHQLYNGDLKQTSGLWLQQPAVSNKNNNNESYQEYCTNHRVTFQKRNSGSHTLPMLASSYTTTVDSSIIDKSHCLLIKSQNKDDTNNNNNNTPVQNSLFHKLNIDILEHIFQFLDRTSLLRCASTCKIGCQFFVEWPYFWKVIKNDPIGITEKNKENGFNEQGIFKEPSTRIGLWVEKILYRKKIQQLVYYYDDTDIDGPIISNKSNDEEEYINEIIHLMADTHYTQLNSIHLSTITNIDPIILGKALTSSSSHLTTIHLYNCNKIPPEIVLGEILDNCSSLLELSYRQQNEIQHQSSNVVDKPYNSTRLAHHCLFSKRNRFALRKLWIDLSNTTRMHCFLPNVIQNWMITTTTAINIINNNRTENYNQQEQNLAAILFDDFTQSHSIPPSSGKPHQGLICFDIFNPTLHISNETLDTILKKHAMTIETIYLPYNGKSWIFGKVVSAMLDNPLIHLRHVFFVSTASFITPSSSDSSTYHSTITSSSSYTTMNDSFDFQSAMIQFISSWKNLESISFNGYYSGIDTSVCITRDILKHLLFQCKKLQQVSFAHCFENIHEFIHGLKAVSMMPSITTTNTTAFVRDLILDCGLLVSFLNRYKIEDYLISGALQNLQVLRVAHVVPDASVTNPCFCQWSATLYKLASVRKILNNRGGDVLYSSPKRSFIIV